MLFRLSKYRSRFAAHLDKTQHLSLRFASSKLKQPEYSGCFSLREAKLAIDEQEFADVDSKR
jgi:hypothetical protein